MFTKSTVPVHLKQLITSCQLGDTAEVLKAWRRGFLDLAANLHPDDTCDPLLNATHFLQPAVVELLCRLGLSPKKRTTVHPYTGDGMVVSELQGISPMELADKMLFLHPRRSKRRQQILEVKALLLKADILSTDPPELPPTADLPIEAEADDELVGDDSESGSDSDEDTSEVERASSTSRATRASARPKSPAASSSPAPTVPPEQNEPKPATAAPKKKSTTSSSASTVPVVLPTTVPTTSPGTGAGLGSGPPPDAVLPAVSSSMRTTTLAPSIPVLVPQASNSFAQPPVIANTPRTTPSTRAPPPPAAPATARIQATADADAAPSPRGAAKPADSVAAPGRPRGRKKRKEREPSATGGDGVEAAMGGRKSKQKSSTAGSRSGAGATSRQRAPPSPEPQSLELQPLTIVDIRALADVVAEPQLSMLHSPRQVEESALLRGVLEGIAVHLMHMLAAAADGEGTADDAGLPDPRHKVQCGTITVCPASDSPITTPIGSMCVRALKERATATDRIQTAAETSTAEPLPRLELPEVTAEAIARYMAWGFVFDDSVEEEDANAARRWQTVGDVLVLDGPEGACLLALRGSRWQDQAIREGVYQADLSSSPHTTKDNARCVSLIVCCALCMNRGGDGTACGTGFRQRCVHRSVAEHPQLCRPVPCTRYSHMSQCISSHYSATQSRAATGATTGRLSASGVFAEPSWLQATSRRHMHRVSLRLQPTQPRSEHSRPASV